MPVQITEDRVLIENVIVPCEAFSGLVLRHLVHYPDTPKLEAKGIELRALDFSEQHLESFIRCVCKWGGYAGIGGRIINQNPITKIRRQFRLAMSTLEIDAAAVDDALRAVNTIQNLGKPSFASKHLRFLRPDICPILDSIVSARLGYRFHPPGYKALAADCAKIGEILQHHQIANPRQREGNKWHIADVEMALFSHLNKL